ncbi:TIGR00180 family glycosyltransferase [Actinomycetota bacterium]|nr:TIGR00180 family glycosyltransferase [Actinomycetota bacterium]
MTSQIPSSPVARFEEEHKLTLVVLSYERQSFVRRQLLYYSSRPVHIVIADGSATPWQDGQSGHSGDMTWEYLHDPGYFTYRDRFAQALERVKTEYVCLVDDQECILWTGLQSAVLTLDAQPDHVCAGGLVSIADLTPNDTMLYPWGHRGVPWELTDPNPIERFRKVTGPDQRSANLYYQVTRTSNLRNFAQMMRSFKGVSTATPEVALAGYLALAGKWAMGPYPYWIRAGGTVPLPLDGVVVISDVEIEEICSKLLELLTRDGPQGGQTVGDVELRELCEAIDYGWGESSQWATASQGYAKKRQTSSKSDSITQNVKKARSYVVAFLRKRAPRAYQRLRPNNAFISGQGLEFLDYARTHAPRSYEVANDLLTVSKIWQSFPQGVSHGDQTSKKGA